MSPPQARAPEPSPRARLVASFVVVSAAKGYEAVDPATVSIHAGLEPDAFERHFESRLACFCAAWDRLEALYLGRLGAAYRAEEGWRDQLRSGIRETLRQIEAHPAPARFMTIESLGAGEPERARQRILATRLAGMLERATRGLEAGEAPAATPNWILAMVFDRIYRHLSSGRSDGLSDQLPPLMFLAVSPYLGAEAALAELSLPAP